MIASVGIIKISLASKYRRQIPLRGVFVHQCYFYHDYIIHFIIMQKKQLPATLEIGGQLMEPINLQFNAITIIMIRCIGHCTCRDHQKLISIEINTYAKYHCEE